MTQKQLTPEEIDALQKILMNYYQGKMSIAAEAPTITHLSKSLSELLPEVPTEPIPKPKETK